MTPASRYRHPRWRTAGRIVIPALLLAIPALSLSPINRPIGDSATAYSQLLPVPVAIDGALLAPSLVTISHEPGAIAVNTQSSVMATGAPESVGTSSSPGEVVGVTSASKGSDPLAPNATVHASAACGGAC